MFKIIKKTTNKIWKPFIFAAGLIIGYLIFIQYEAYRNVSKNISRDTAIDVFKEIDFMLETNRKLEGEAQELAKKMEDYGDRAKARETIKTDTKRYEMILGLKDIEGQGVSLTIDAPLNTAFMVDIINEFLNAGAEAVSVNNIRLEESFKGFIETGGKMILSGVILSPPYIFEAIGDKNHLKKALEQSGGILIRVRQAFPQSQIQIEEKDKIIMKKTDKL